MTERRPHWDDDLIDAVRDAVDVEFDGIWKLSEDSILAVIAAVEDWARWEHVPKGTLLRLERADAVIARVRERAELRFGIPAVQGTYQAGYAAAMNDILRSLEGDSDE